VLAGDLDPIGQGLARAFHHHAGLVVWRGVGQSRAFDIDAPERLGAERAEDLQRVHVFLSWRALDRWRFGSRWCRRSRRDGGRWRRLAGDQQQR